MTYKEKNYELLQELHKLLQAFPFNKEVEFRLASMDLKAINNCYEPYSDVNTDEVANAICWSVITLELLLDKSPVRALDEVLSFVTIVLDKEVK